MVAKGVTSSHIFFSFKIENGTVEVPLLYRRDWVWTNDFHRVKVALSRWVTRPCELDVNLEVLFCLHGVSKLSQCSTALALWRSDAHVIYKNIFLYYNELFLSSFFRPQKKALALMHLCKSVGASEHEKCQPFETIRHVNSQYLYIIYWVILIVIPSERLSVTALERKSGRALGSREYPHGV